MSGLLTLKLGRALGQLPATIAAVGRLRRKATRAVFAGAAQPSDRLPLGLARGERLLRFGDAGLMRRELLRKRGQFCLGLADTFSLSRLLLLKRLDFSLDLKLLPLEQSRPLGHHGQLALDRFGLRLGMLLAVSIWTVASASHAVAAGFLGFVLVRAMLGFGEGATFPGGLRTVIQTLPLSLRARGVAVAYSGGSLGAVVTPLIVTPLALAFGWRAAFLFTGLIGACWLGLWLLVSRRRDVRERESVEPAESLADKLLFSDPRLWSYMLAYAFGALPIAFVIYAAALYLNSSFGASQSLIGTIPGIYAKICGNTA